MAGLLFGISLPEALPKLFQVFAFLFISQFILPGMMNFDKNNFVSEDFIFKLYA